MMMKMTRLMMKKMMMIMMMMMIMKRSRMMIVIMVIVVMVMKFLFLWWKFNTGMLHCCNGRNSPVLFLLSVKKNPTKKLPMVDFFLSTTLKRSRHSPK